MNDPLRILMPVFNQAGRGTYWLRPVETFFEERFRTQADATTVICCAAIRDFYS